MPDIVRHLQLSRQSRGHEPEDSVGALIIGIGFWGPLYHNHNKEPPQNSIGNYLSPDSRLWDVGLVELWGLVWRVMGLGLLGCMMPGFRFGGFTEPRD